jgi:hypothetical protein
MKDCFYQYSHSDPNEELRFAEEIEKHMITDFSTLELHLTTLEHAFGAFLLRLLGMHRIRNATRSLKISLHRFEVICICVVYTTIKYF